MAKTCACLKRHEMAFSLTAKKYPMVFEHTAEGCTGERRIQSLPVEVHRRWDDCVMDPATKACKGCGKPMSEESLINRAL